MEYDLDLQESGGYEPHEQLRDYDSPDRVAQREELREALQTAIDSLPEELRVAIIFREIEGMSYEEIATAMNCPVGTVRSRIFRARDAIDKAIRTYVDGPDE
jgi:RNA polymerase sigma-70 factor (ECF subfamily)